MMSYSCICEIFFMYFATCVLINSWRAFSNWLSNLDNFVWFANTVTSRERQGSQITGISPVCLTAFSCHDDVMKWKHFPRYWLFVRGIHRSPVNSPHKGQWRGALMFSLMCARINSWVNNREAGDLRRYRRHYDVIVMSITMPLWWWFPSKSARNAESVSTPWR